VRISTCRVSYTSKRETRSSTGTSPKTLLVYRKFNDEEKKSTRIPLYNKGQDIDDYYPPGSLQIKEKDDSVTWKLGGRTHIGKLPHFTVTTAARPGPSRYTAVR
jgi:hypothetical protein